MVGLLFEYTIGAVVAQKGRLSSPIIYPVNLAVVQIFILAETALIGVGVVGEILFVVVSLIAVLAVIELAILMTSFEGGTGVLAVDSGFSLDVEVATFVVLFVEILFGISWFVFFMVVFEFSYLMAFFMGFLLFIFEFVFSWKLIKSLWGTGLFFRGKLPCWLNCWAPL